MVSDASGPVLQAKRWTELGLGFGEMITGYSQRTLATTTGIDSPDDRENPGIWDVLSVVPGASAAIALRLQETALAAVSSAEQVTSRIADGVGVNRLTGPILRWAHSRLTPLDAEFKTAQTQRAAVAEGFLAAAGPQVLQELLLRVDLDALLSEVDLEKILDRVDLDSLIDRIDVDRLTDRIDVERLLDRVDVNELANLVLHDLEVPGLLRGGTEAIATSTVGALRSQVEGVSRRLGRRP